MKVQSRIHFFSFLFSFSLFLKYTSNILYFRKCSKRCITFFSVTQTNTGYLNWFSYIFGQFKAPAVFSLISSVYIGTLKINIIKRLVGVSQPPRYIGREKGASCIYPCVVQTRLLTQAFERIIFRLLFRTVSFHSGR